VVVPLRALGGGVYPTGHNRAGARIPLLGDGEKGDDPRIGKLGSGRGED